MARHQKRDERAERLRAMWQARRRNAPNRADYRLAVEHLQSGAVTAARRELKHHSDDQVFRVAESILVFGLTAPIIVDAEMRIVAGHALWLAAKCSGWRRYLSYAGAI